MTNSCISKRQLGNRFSVMPSMVRVTAAALATLLISTGLVHLASPYYFAFTLASYRIIPERVLWIAAPAIASSQIYVGCLLLAERKQSLAFYLSSTMFLTFALAQAWVLFKGYKISCGCFGWSDSVVSAKTIAIPLLAMAVSLFGLRAAGSKFCGGFGSWMFGSTSK